MNHNSKLGIVVSHPIQYYAPLFKYLANRLSIIVFYCHNPNEEEIGKSGFGLKFKWDVDLLDGYDYVFLHNKSAKPDLSSFKGCDTPDIGAKIKEYGVTHVLIMGWYLKSYWQAWLYCLRKKIPMAVRGDSQLNPDENILKSMLKKIIYPLFIKRYDVLFYVGERNKEYLLKHGAKEEQLIFAPHAVDQSFWSDPQPNKSLNPTKTIFLWVAKFIPVKQPLEVIQAFCKAMNKVSNMELWMVGAGELLQDSINIANQNPAIKILGFKNQTELRTIYSQVHCLILSSRSETWGLVVNEAFSMGVPAIVSNACGCVPDLMEENNTGYVYESGNVSWLTDRIVSFCKKNEINPNFSKSAIDKKNNIYSYESNFNALYLFLTKN